MSSEQHSDQRLGFMLKLLMKERALSMRKLSELTGIHTATISRIVSGKQSARPEHLQKLSAFFNVPLKQLFEAAGFDMKHEEDRHDIQSSVEMIQETLEFSNLFDQQNIIPRVQQELNVYERYALTEEGRQLIRDRFQIKAQHIDGMGPFIEQLMQMHADFFDGSVTEKKRAVMGSVLLYFIYSTDIIPDYVFPIGYLDDAIAIQLGVQRLAQLE